MKNFLVRLLLTFLFLAPVSALAQSSGTVVVDCTTGVGLAYSVGSNRPPSILPTGQACVNVTGAVTQGTVPWVDNISQWGGVATSLGQKATASSVPVTLPSDPDSRPSPGNITTQDIGSSTATGQNGVSIITGTPTALSFQTFAINGQAVARCQISGTWTGTLQFNGSIDSGTTYQPLQAQTAGALYTQSQVTANGIFNIAASGITNIRVRAMAVMTGTATVTCTFSGVGDLVNAGAPFTLASANLPTYNIASSAYSPYATPTDLFCIWGSASKTVYVTNATFRIGSTTGTLIDFFWYKRTTLNTGGTPTTISAVNSYDSTNPAASASVVTYAAAPTTGTGAVIREAKVTTAVLTAIPANVTFFLAGIYGVYGVVAANNLQQPIVLRGVAEGLCLNFNGAAVPLGTATTIDFEWTEKSN